MICGAPLNASYLTLCDAQQSCIGTVVISLRGYAPLFSVVAMLPFEFTLMAFCALNVLYDRL
jgi:hypothetical protein